jgi:hypothetical protein
MSPITPHPLATWVSMQVSPQRHDRLRRRRRAARLLAARRAAAAAEARPVEATGRDRGTVVTVHPKIPAQRTRTATVPPGTVTSSPATTD